MKSHLSLAKGGSPVSHGLTVHQLDGRPDEENPTLHWQNGGWPSPTDQLSTSWMGGQMRKIPPFTGEGGSPVSHGSTVHQLDGRLDEENPTHHWQRRGCQSPTYQLSTSWIGDRMRNISPFTGEGGVARLPRLDCTTVAWAPGRGQLILLYPDKSLTSGFPLFSK